jgi:hypothetical protein
MIRTSAGGIPRMQRDLVAVHVRRLGADGQLDPVADAPREPGLRLDVRVLDPGRLDLDRRRHVRARERVSTSPCARRPRISTLPGDASWSCGGVGRERVIDAAERGQRLPGDRQLGVRDGGDRRLVAHERENASPRWRTNAVRERRLVLAGRVDPVAVLAGHVAAADHVDEPGCARRSGPRRRSRISRARAAIEPRGRPANRRVRWSAPKRAVPSTRGSPSTLASRDPTAAPATGAVTPLAPAEAPANRASRVARDRLDDLHVARAAAQDPADPIEDRLVVGVRVHGKERLVPP